ncbi:MAG TPA: hypothetical protein VHA78_06000 [Candidatus Peribacteraceae bacterium]|nr:hypothetical protein [Candidatus Peribacteraceae bacterium]
MACYAFTNCALAGAPFIDTRVGDERSVCNMRTDGIVRLLAGGGFELHREDQETLFATENWASFRTNRSTFPRWSQDTFHRFQPIAVLRDDVFLWSPFADCLCSFTTARCADGTMYPYVLWPIGEVFPHAARVPFTTVQALWREMDRLTAHVERRGIVLYPPDRLIDLFGDSAHTRDLVAHITFYNERAVGLLQSRGWSVFTPDAEIDEHDRNWGHYSKSSKLKLWTEIEHAFFRGGSSHQREHDGMRGEEYREQSGSGTLSAAASRSSA